MICPFCAEEIRDAATVCRHCRHDLAAVRTLQERIATLEVQLEQAHLVGADVSGSTAATGLVARHRSVGRAIIAVFASFACYAIFIGVEVYPTTVPNPPWLLLAPLPFGVWLGLRYDSVKGFVLLGALIGAGAFTMFVAAVLLYTDLSFIVRAKSLPLTFAILIVPAFLFCAGGLIGGWIARMRSTRLAGPLATKLAKQLIGARSGSDGISDRTIQRLATVISAIAPILTFIASLLAAYATYVAAVANHPANK